MKATDLEIKVAAIALQKAGRLTEPNLRAEIRGGSSQRVRRIIHEVLDSAPAAETSSLIPAPAAASPTGFPALLSEDRSSNHTSNPPSMISAAASAPEFFGGRHSQIARAVLDLSLPEAAKAAKVSRSTLTRFEAGEKVSSRMRIALFEFFSSQGVILRKTSIGWNSSSAAGVNREARA